MKDISNQKFNRLTAISLAHIKNKHRFWNCVCECGNSIIVRADSLTTGNTKSCGCFQIEQVKKTMTKHGEATNLNRSPEYRAYYAAKARCQNPNDTAYPRYGGRGIKFLFTNFQAFIDAVGRKPRPYYSIERKNNDGHYEPTNCKWATKSEQARNRRKPQHKIRTP